MKNKFLTLILAAASLVLVGCGDKGASEPSISLPEETSSSTSSTPVEQSSASGDKTSSSNNAGTSSVVIPSTDSRWNVNLGEYGNAFRTTLESLITSKRTKTISYKECLATGAKAAAYPTATSSTFVPFYHDTSTTATTGQCNREHTWPNSRGSGESGPGADPFIIRPTLTKDNSSRGNNFYGNEKSNEWDPASCGFEAARGEASRVILYAATAYHTSKGFELSNNPGDGATLKTMGTLKTLLEWNAKYAPTTIEIQINDYLSDHGFGRNPFVDHPEYANYIWNENGIRNSSVSGGGNTTSSETPAEPAVKYDLVKSIDALANTPVAIVTSQDGETSWMGMTKLAKSETLPWYINGVQTTLYDDKAQMSTEAAQLAFFNINKQSTGDYKILTDDGEALYNYVSTSTDGKEHYSICFGEPSQTTTKQSDTWKITMSANGACVFEGTSGVFLEYYNNSFCGYKSKPSAGIYLYK